MTKEQAAIKIKELVDQQTFEISQDLNLHEVQTIQLNNILAYIALTSFNMGEVYGREKSEQERLGEVWAN